MFPLGIGRRGKIDETWLAYYLPCIFAISKEMKGKIVYFEDNGINCFLTWMVNINKMVLYPIYLHC